jgi:hypothetical protein
LKNITLAIEEGLLGQARGLAARRGTTLNALVRQMLTEAVDQERRIKDAKAGLKSLMENSTGRLGPDYRWNREELYAGRVLPRHKRTGLRGGRKA